MAKSNLERKGFFLSFTSGSQSTTRGSQGRTSRQELMEEWGSLASFLCPAQIAFLYNPGPWTQGDNRPSTTTTNQENVSQTCLQASLMGWLACVTNVVKLMRTATNSSLLHKSTPWGHPYSPFQDTAYILGRRKKNTGHYV